ncbi:MAG: hypothetical protein O9262_00545, partial [Cyclobacteriaceae bacterium]|nr:hypothetical protein [Cyclobacteriaceae bacterium]
MLANYSESYSYIKAISPGDLSYLEALGDSRTEPIDQSGESISQSIYFPQYLSQISFPSGRLLFSWASRSDILNEKRLFKIELLNKNDQLIKTINFNNSNYFQGVSDSYRPNFSYANSPYFNCDCIEAGLTENDVQLKRLKLSGITFSDHEKPYTFLYDETVALPAKMSFASDYWGYYNGNNNATSFYPNLYNLFLKFPDDLYMSSSNGSRFLVPNSPNHKTPQDRRSDLNFTKAWSLKKIIYPTGGFSEFEFELNTVDNFDFAGKNDYLENSALANITYYGAPGNVSTSGNSSSSFRIPIEQTVEINYKFDLRLMDNLNPNLNVRIQVLNSEQQVIFEERFRQYNEPIPQSESCTKPYFRKYIDLNPGDYQVKIITDGDIQSCVHKGLATIASITVNVAFRTPLTSHVSRVGGLRIKFNKDHDGTRYTKIRKY